MCLSHRKTSGESKPNSLFGGTFRPTTSELDTYWSSNAGWSDRLRFMLWSKQELSTSVVPVISRLCCNFHPRCGWLKKTVPASDVADTQETPHVFFYVFIVTRWCSVTSWWNQPHELVRYMICYIYTYIYIYIYIHIYIYTYMYTYNL